MERGQFMRPVHRSLFPLAFVAAGLIWQRPLAAENAASDPAAVAKADAAQKLADAAIDKRKAAEAVVAGEQGKVKTAAQGLAKAKADESKAVSDVAAAEKAFQDKTAAAKKAAEDAKTLEKPATDAAAAAKVAADAKAAADKLSADQAAIAKATADTAAAAKIAAEKAPGDKGVSLLKTLADTVAADAAGASKDSAAKAEAAAKPVADTAAAAKAAGDKLAAAQKVAADMDAAAKAAEPAIAAAKANVPKAQEVSKQAEAVVAAAKAEVDKAVAALNAVGVEATAAVKASEEALAAIGKFVSFSKHVAPIFSKRCLACHNAQTAKGRYNMDNYVGVVKGGEQGDTIIPKDADGSNLVALLEEGTMPKDADPLTKDEIALIKQWIVNGARLDAGLKSESPLVTIVPKLPQPPPPEAYRVPIPVTATAFNPDGSLLASSGYHEVILWNTADGKAVRRITNIAERIYDIEFNKEGTLLAVAAGTPGQQGEVRSEEHT